MSSSQQRYRVLEKLEAGGMAEVFRAESEGLEGFSKQVAIKRVLPHLSEKTKFIAMFLDEARLSAQLSHSNVVQVFDIGRGDNTFFIVMEFVDGVNLKAIAESFATSGQRMPIQVAAYITTEICKGLEYAHGLQNSAGEPLGIVHRDISPPNILITKFGEVKIVDFGLAKASSQLERSEPGIIKGKFAYLSPEAAEGKEVDARADIFAVGIILWEALTGERLFLGESDLQTVRNVQAAVVRAPSEINRQVPPELDRIVIRALARNVSERYGSAREMAVDIYKFLYGYGRPVSSYDVSNMVQATMRGIAGQLRQTGRYGAHIDQLIEEALFEFTSLRKDSLIPAAPVPVAAPLSPTDFIDPTNWANETQGADGNRAREIRESLRAVTEGNLSAIEDMGLTPGPHGFALPTELGASSRPVSSGFAPPALPQTAFTQPPAAQLTSLRPRPSAMDINRPAAPNNGASMILIGALAGALLMVIAGVIWQLAHR